MIRTFLFILNALICKGIFNGRYAVKGEFPFAVCFVIGIDRPYCTGILVTNARVLTAGHCITNYDSGMKAVTGVLDISDHNNKEYQESLIDKVDRHPKYEDRGNKQTLYDIGIAVLKKPFKYTDTVQPMKIVSKDPKKFDQELYSYVGDYISCKGYGWGMQTANESDPNPNTKYSNASLKLKALGLTPWSYEKCGIVSKNDPIDLRTIGQICIASTEKGSTICVGDSGGGFICDDYAFGVTSGTFGCGKNLPASYLSIAQYIGYFKLEGNVVEIPDIPNSTISLIIVNSFLCIASMVYLKEI